MSRGKTKMKLIVDYEKEIRDQETCRVKVRKGGNYKAGQVRSTG